MSIIGTGGAIKIQNTLRKIVYTIITGGYESHKAPQQLTDDWDYVQVVSPGKSQRYAREFKLLPPFWNEYDLSIWHDGNIQINCDLDQFVKENFNTGLAVMKHPGWDCVYQEGKIVKSSNKDKSEVVDAQLKKYMEEGYPLCNGLVATGVMIRKHTKDVKKFCELWWKELQNGSLRDQLSFNYVMWKNEIPYNLIDWNILDSNEFIYHHH